MKSTILWCARWMLGDGAFYEGKLQVVIGAAEEGESVVVKPVRGMDGLVEPESLRDTASVEATQDELLRVLFSRDEVRILSEMLGERAVKAGAVLDGCRIEKSKFWSLWSNLQQRGIVVDADVGEGFVIGLAWVREVLRGKSDGARPAA